MPYGHASMLLLGKGSEATEPYNKYDKIRPHSIRSLQFDQKVRPLFFRLEKFDLFTATHLNQGSLCNPGTTATEAEAHKIEKYRELIDNGYIFQPVALEVQGSLGESSEIFITRFCKMLCSSHDDQRAGSFLKQRISMALQIGNAACVLGTVIYRDAFEEIYYI